MRITRPTHRKIVPLLAITTLTFGLASSEVTCDTADARPSLADLQTQIDDLNARVTQLESVASNPPPIAEAGPGTCQIGGTAVLLDGFGSVDPEGEVITYEWTFLSMPPGSTATLSNPTIANPTFTPDVDGIYQLALFVDDGVQRDGDSVAVEVSSSPGQIVSTGASMRGGVAGTPIEPPLEIQVFNDCQLLSAIPLPDVAVNWSATNAVVDAATTITDSSGYTSVSGSYGPVPGAGSIFATAVGPGGASDYEFILDVQ